MATINIVQKEDYILQIWNIFWYGSTWYNGSYILTGATDTSTGKYNSASIYDQQGVGTYASSLCETSTAGGFTDWYLPNIEELEDIFLYGNGSMGTTDIYWSSTEIDLNNAWAFDSSTGLRVSANKNVNTYLSIMARQEVTNIPIDYNRMSELSKNAPILSGGVDNADEDVYKMLGGVNGISKNSKIISNE
jgi:hypothetical protein